MLTLALLSTSCAAPKKASQSESRSEYSYTSQNTLTQGSRTEAQSIEETERLLTARIEAWLASREEQDRELEREVEIYDTQQPVDSATGTSPLLARVRERERARIRNETGAKMTGTETDSLHSEAKDSISASDNLTARHEAEGTESEQEESREQKGSNRAILPTAVLVLLGILAAVYVIFKRHSNNN